MFARFRRIAAACGRTRPASRSPAVAVAAAAWAVLALAATPAAAQVWSNRYASLVIDAGSGNVLEEVNADEPRYPASLTKLMTLYMAFEALRDHRVGLDELVPVSWHAASMMPVKLGLVPATNITVEQTMLAMVTLSANDAACALGELLGGDEERFAQMMTLRARSLGMTRTTFRNASGLPDPEQVSTAHDLAVLARHLVQDFPDDYTLFSTPSFSFHGREILNHDTMLRIYPGADGLKTGYTELSGRNLVTSAVRGGVRLIGVVLGMRSNGERDVHMTSLLDDGFERMDVPVQRRAPSRMRVPALIAAADAAVLPLRFAPAPYRGALHASPRLRARHVMAERALEFAPAPRGAGPAHGRGGHGHAFARPVADDVRPRLLPVIAHRHAPVRAEACTRRHPCER
ncbi:MAG: D-alanyl-D-alanine carboxypeptidase family protein [Janthinobacterium lividum]